MLSIFEVYSQQKLNWAEVVYGNIKGLKENKIKTLKLKKGNKVLRAIEVISDKLILVKDSLNTQYFDFDDENRLISVKSVKDMWQQQFNLNFKNNYVNQLSKTIDNNGIVSFSKFSKVSFNNTLYEEREVYNFDCKKNDSLNVFRIKYFFNQQNPDLSYRETYNNGKIWNKKYFNQTEVTKEKFDGHFIRDRGADVTINAFVVLVPSDVVCGGEGDPLSIHRMELGKFFFVQMASRAKRVVLLQVVSDHNAPTKRYRAEQGEPHQEEG